MEAETKPNYSYEDYADFKRDMALAKKIATESPDWYRQMKPDIDKEKREYKRALPTDVYNAILNK